MIKLKPRELYVQCLCTIYTYTEINFFQKTDEVLSGIKVGVVFLCVYFFSNGGGGGDNWGQGGN